MSDQRIVEEAERRYREYLVKSGRRDIPGQKQVFLDGYITGLHYGFEFGEFISNNRVRKSKGERHGKKQRKE